MIRIIKVYYKWYDMTKLSELTIDYDIVGR